MREWSRRHWLGFAFAVATLTLIVGAYGLALTVGSSGSGGAVSAATMVLGALGFIITGVLLLFEIYGDL